MEFTFFDIIKNIYTKQDYSWIKDIPEDISAVAIYQALCNNIELAEQLKKVAKYIFWVSNIQGIILLHSIIPKVQRAPFIPSPKKEDPQSEVMAKIQKHLSYSSHEMTLIRNILNKILSDELCLKQLSYDMGIKQ